MTSLWLRHSLSTAGRGLALRDFGTDLPLPRLICVSVSLRLLCAHFQAPGVAPYPPTKQAANPAVSWTFRGARGHVTKLIIIQGNTGCAVAEDHYGVEIRGMTLDMLVRGPLWGQ